MEEEKPLNERVIDLEKIAKSGKVKELRIPSKAKVRGAKLKKGWIGVLRISENGNIEPTKEQIKGSVFRCKDGTSTGTYHTTDGREVLFWKGRFPVIVQEDKKVNPKNFKFNEGDNQTYGQEKIIATMLKDAITLKKKGGGGIVIFLVVGVVLFIIGKFVFKLF